MLKIDPSHKIGHVRLPAGIVVVLGTLEMGVSNNFRLETHVAPQVLYKHKTQEVWAGVPVELDQVSVAVPKSAPAGIASVG